MAERVSRKDLLARLNVLRKSGQPIIGAGASAGIIGKCAEIGGADMLIIYSTGKSRLMGLPTSRIGDSNAITMSMLTEISNVTSRIPMIAGVEATDPTRLDLSRLLDRFIEHDTSGVINFPTVLMMPSYADKREMVGLGFSREVELIRKARDKDLFTMAYVFEPDQAARVADAGCDCICAHVGVTKGGLVPVRDDRPLDELAASVQRLFDAAVAVNPDIIRLAHGGGYSAPEDTRSLYAQTSAEGFVGASSIERIPIEKAVVDVVREFKAIPINDAS
jgi:predicted TIM-barrel enzyme